MIGSKSNSQDYEFKTLKKILNMHACNYLYAYKES